MRHDIFGLKLAHIQGSCEYGPYHRVQTGAQYFENFNVTNLVIYGTNSGKTISLDDLFWAEANLKYFRGLFAVSV